MTLKESSEEQLKSTPGMVYLNTEDIANAVLYILGTPPNVQVKTKMFFIYKIIFQLNIYKLN